MQLTRIVLAGALLFGAGCELPDEGELTTDQRVEPSNDSLAETKAALSGVISEAAIDDASPDAEDQAELLGGGDDTETAAPEARPAATARIADYAIIRDTFFTISTGADIDKSFDFPVESGGHVGSRSILAFVVFVSKATSNIQIQVWINGSKQQTYNLVGRLHGTMHEVINSNVLTVGTNEIEFRITDGSGSVKISDVVLHYQRDI